MADKMPNYSVEIFRLEVEIDTLRLNIKRNELRVMELKDEIRRLEENGEASLITISEYEEKLKGLKEVHQNG